MINDFGINRWIKEINETDNLLIKCCYCYFYNDTNVNVVELQNSLEQADLNDYKNVSALAYLYMAKVDVELPLVEGINRISGKSIKSSKLLIADEMAILALVLVIKTKLIQYQSWIQQIVYEHNKFVIEMGYDKGFSIAIDEFLNNNSNIRLDMSDYYSITKIWLEKEKGNLENTLDLQERIAQEIWINSIPYFKNDFYDLIACGVIKSLISNKFLNGIVSIEKKFNRAIKKAEGTGKRYFYFCFSFIIFVISIAVVYFFKELIDYVISIQTTKDSLFIPIALNIIAVVGIPISTYKLIIKKRKSIKEHFIKRVQKHRGLE